MKKIPTLFERVFENHRIVGITDTVHPGMEWVLNGEGVATIKLDGSCCAIINGEFYKRYDAKKGKKAPEGAIPCCPPDPVTGHHPHWVKISADNPSDKWFLAALDYTRRSQPFVLKDGTYEAIGLHFQNNPYDLNHDRLCRHGDVTVRVERTIEGIRKWLIENPAHEGLVFWKDGEPQCKIKRTDFGLSFPVKK